MTSQIHRLVVAHDPNGLIGVDNTLPWMIPEDMAHFKALTNGTVVLMGRKTYESLPERFRPLPGRLNAVMTRSSSFSAPGAIVFDTSLPITLVKLTQLPISGIVHIIGGSSIYQQALQLEQPPSIYVTKILEPIDPTLFKPEQLHYMPKYEDKYTMYSEHPLTNPNGGEPRAVTQIWLPKQN